MEHEATLKKIEKLGFGQQAVKLLRDYLCHRQDYTEIGTSQSNLQEVKHGVPQGSILGPLIYII